MKSLILLSSLLLLASCGKEQFGTAAQSESTQANALKTLHQASCASHTLIKPKVDILYVVDNSQSAYYIDDSIRSSINQTIDTISKEFDYRVIAIPLLAAANASTPNTEFQVLTNSADPLPSGVSPLHSSQEFFFYKWTPPTGGQENGLRRIQEFMSDKSSLFRPSAYHLIVLISNGRDTEVEVDAKFGNGETVYTDPNIFQTRATEFASLRTQLQSAQLRMLSLTTATNCEKSGWLTSEKSYRKMSEHLYAVSGATDSQINKDRYNLCNNNDVRNIYSAVNSSIQKILLPHKYQYWPITFAENNETVDISKLKVFKYAPGTSPVAMSANEWSYHPHSGSPLNTRVFPTPGEAVTGNHFIKFTTPLEYPNCVQVTSTTKTEYFGYIALPRKPLENSIVVKINGILVPKSSSNGWSFNNTLETKNIKMPYPTSDHENPKVDKSGYMIKLNGTQNYYKSGDSVDVFYTPAPI